MTGRRIILFCGLGTSGKDFWAQRVLKQLAFKSVFVGIAQARRTYWGASEQMTDADHLLKNEITLLEVKKQFVIWSMVRATEVLLAQKAAELAKRSGVAVETQSIAVRAVWMMCDHETTLRRLQARQAGANPDGGLLTLSEFEKGKTRFQEPVLYPSIQIDTSDERVEADVKRENVIMQFVTS